MLISGELLFHNSYALSMLASQILLRHVLLTVCVFVCVWFAVVLVRTLIASTLKVQKYS